MRLSFGPSCTELSTLNAGILIMIMIDDVLTEHGGLLHVLPLAVHFRFSEPFFLLSFFLWDPSFMILVSFGFGTKGLGTWG